jgi:hypothetical protein
LLVLFAAASYAVEPIVTSPDSLSCTLSQTETGWLLKNNDARAGTVRISGAAWRKPIVFELGKGGSHLRRLYPRLTKQSLSLRVGPSSEYEIVEAGAFAGSVLKSVYPGDLSGLSTAEKLDRLAAVYAELRTSGKEAASRMKLVSEAYQALAGLEVGCAMSFPAENASADYKIFAGRDFHAACTVANRGTLPVSARRVRLLAPDEWTVKLTSGRSTLSSLSPGNAARFDFAVKAPGRSTYRPKLFPLMAEVAVEHKGVDIPIIQPYTVELAEPLTAALQIKSANQDRIEATVKLQSLFRGEEMKDTTVYYYMPNALKMEPGRQTFSLRDRGEFRVTYLKDGASGFTLRALTMVIRADEHPLRLRSVMEAVLDLGQRTRSSGLWVNEYEDGLTTASEIGGKACRQTVKNPLGDARYMYFEASPNFPGTGATYVTVTYFDGPQGTFTVQYDSLDASPEGACKDAPESVKLQGTGAWRQKTFALPDAGFSGRQNSKSDFRIAVSGSDLAVAEIAISKFPSVNEQS